MVSSSLTSFSWTSCRSHGFSEFSTALQSMMDMMDVMDGGVMVAFLLLIVEFVRAVTICRVWPSSSCYLLLASMLGQWVRAWSESGVSWVWPPLFLLFILHKHVSQRWKQNVSNIFQRLWRCFRAMKWMWRVKTVENSTADQLMESTSSPLDPRTVTNGFSTQKNSTLDSACIFSSSTFWLEILFPELGTCFCYRTFLRKSPWTNWEWWHLSGYPRFRISCVVWKSWNPLKHQHQPYRSIQIHSDP